MSLELQLAQVYILGKNLYTRKDLKYLGIGSLFVKQFLILNQLKTSLMITLSLQTFLESFEIYF